MDSVSNSAAKVPLPLKRSPHHTHPLPLRFRPPPRPRRHLVPQFRLLKLERGRQDLNLLVDAPLAPAHLPEPLGVLEQVRASLLDGGVALPQQRLHLVVVPHVEPFVAGAQGGALRFVVLAQPVVPDVVLRQADVDVEGDGALAALEQRVQDGCGADEAGLVVGVRCGYQSVSGGVDDEGARG